MGSDWKHWFYGKRVTVMGLGLLGRGIGDVKFLAENGAELIVTDLKTADELVSSLKKLKKFKNIKYVLGGHHLEDFRNRDFILKTAGVPLDSPFIREARKNKIPVEMSTSLFARLTLATVIGVTGTRGKSTVTHLIYEILKNAGKRVYLGGNVRGISTLPLLKKTKTGDVVVAELDSWQLQGFGDSKISPHIAVFTNLLPDHLNYYKNDMKKYLADKANIFKYQKKNDFLILGKYSSGLIRKKYKNIKSKIITPKDLDETYQLKIPGMHNRYNASLAVEVARTLGIKDEVIKKTLREFTGVPGRIQLVKKHRGVKIYNDTTATTPSATIAALKAVGKKTKGNVVLIMGGADKGIDMTELLKEIPVYCKAVVLLPGTGSSKLKVGSLKSKVEEVKHLKEAVTKAVVIAKPGDTMLFSPAFASFGMFKNEFDRGDQFNKLVSRL